MVYIGKDEEMERKNPDGTHRLSKKTHTGADVVAYRSSRSVFRNLVPLFYSASSEFSFLGDPKVPFLGLDLIAILLILRHSSGRCFTKRSW